MDRGTSAGSTGQNHSNSLVGHYRYVVVSFYSHIFKLLNLFKAGKKFTIDLTKDKLTLKMLVDKNFDFQKNKNSINQIIKELFNSKIIVTFDVDCADFDGYAYLNLYFDISYSKEIYYLVKNLGGTKKNILFL